MYIIIIKRLKNRIFLSSGILAFWISMIIISNFILSKSVTCSLKLENNITLSYPASIKIEKIFVNKRYTNNYIETTSSFSRALTQQFSNFNSLKGKFSFDYPSSFTLSQKYFEGSDIIYHIDFCDKNCDMHGFIQVWNLPYSLKNFLEQSKATSLQNFKSFSSNEITINNMPGYHWEYVVIGNDGKQYHGNEVFFKKNNKMYRISYFVPAEKWNEKEKSVFWKMVTSIKTY